MNENIMNIGRPIVFMDAKSVKNHVCVSIEFATTAECLFERRSERLVRSLNENAFRRRDALSSVLMTVQHRFRRVLIYLRAHLLYLRRLLVSTLANLGNCSLEVSLLLCHGRLQLRNRRLLLLHFALFF